MKIDTENRLAMLRTAAVVGFIIPPPPCRTLRRWVSTLVVAPFCAFAAAAAQYDITAYGAKGDGRTDNTAAIQKAIDECSAAGGGRVLVPAGGTFLTYTLALKDNVDLHVERGAKLLGGEDPLKYPLFEPSEHWNSERALRFNRRAMFYTVAQKNVSISGAGVIDGNNEKFHHQEKKKNWTGYNWWRNSHTNVTGRCVLFVGCKDVRLDDVLILNPGGWATWFLDCDRVGVRGVRIQCDHRFPNGDGLHFGGCRDVVVSDCVVDSQDDALVIRCHQEQMKKSRPCERVMVNNCILRSARCFAIRMGWRGDGPMKDMSLSNIMCPHSRWGVGFFYPGEASGWAKHKDPPRGQGLEPPPPETLIPFYAENIRFSNVNITCEDEPLWIRVDDDTPFQYMRDISFSDCTFRSGFPPHVECCAKHRGHFSNWRFHNTTFDFKRMKYAKKPTAADLFRAVDGFEFVNTRFSLPQRKKSAFSPEDVLVPLPRETSVREGKCPADAKPVVGKDETLPAEGYSLSISPDGVKILCRDAAGEFYARKTLEQLKDGANALPCVEIRDWPAFAWRGIMLDEARTFFGKHAVKKLLDTMASYKLNVFHWHLTDSQAWRIDIPGWPNLVKSARKRGICAAEAPLWYSAADIKEIVAYAAERHITVVPEIDFPGHFGAAVRAYPSLACENGSKDTMCVGNTSSVRFAEHVLDRVCELFPGAAIHIGGDECPANRWAKCPKCKAFMEREGLSGVAAIQPWLTRRLARHLEAKGRRLCGWEEIAVGFGKPDERGESNNNSTLPAELLPPKSVLVMGYHAKPGARAANMGYDVVAAPNWHCYFDYTQRLADDPYRYFRPDIRWCPLEAAHSFDPYELVEPAARSRVKGVECCLWTSHTYSRSIAEVEWKLFPRTFAFAETAWSNIPPAKRDYAGFLKRAARQRGRLIANHVNCAPLK